MVNIIACLIIAILTIICLISLNSLFKELLKKQIRINELNIELKHEKIRQAKIYFIIRKYRNQEYVNLTNFRELVSLKETKLISEYVNAKIRLELIKNIEDEILTELSNCVNNTDTCIKKN